MAVKKILEVRREVAPHWVGDGFPVRTLFSYDKDPSGISPFLLLDYAGPMEFLPADHRRGVGGHPHRGFETVTIVHQGELEHRDSKGHHGKIGPGDVQWMTAASGLVHEEFHGENFTRNGGTLEMAQLWVNLPAAEKMSPPRYQEITAKQIPVVPLEGKAGTARVIAGTFRDKKGPAKTATPIELWDLRLNAAGHAPLELEDGFSTILLVRNGSVTINGKTAVKGVALILLEPIGDRVELACGADEGASVLVLAGEPIDEPIAGRGPFVMNTPDELRRAIRDYQSGAMGSLG